MVSSPQRRRTSLSAPLPPPLPPVLPPSELGSSLSDKLVPNSEGGSTGEQDDPAPTKTAPTTTAPPTTAHHDPAPTKTAPTTTAPTTAHDGTTPVDAGATPGGVVLSSSPLLPMIPANFFAEASLGGPVDEECGAHGLLEDCLVDGPVDDSSPLHDAPPLRTPVDDSTQRQLLTRAGQDLRRALLNRAPAAIAAPLFSRATAICSNGAPKTNEEDRSSCSMVDHNFG